MWQVYWLNWMDIWDSAAGIAFLWIVWQSYGPLLPHPWGRFLQSLLIVSAFGFWAVWGRNVGLFAPYLVHPAMPPV
ncbi:hypothetical protein [Sulfobacillus sp. hq2]|uniref:hypothetical protein n=1 Tax=Sulfobacillus TaxID=28033 RepID=UPI000CD28C26|nr:hypothetical protein [Sulfobacillus sp. hq2]POB12321.1 hypothetical protein CO251_00190 [Sulfobacillus sp. hq2]